MANVELEHVTKQYGAAPPSVRDLNLTIEDGEFFTLLGPSGCGKSTTLRMLAGFVAPTTGTIRFQGNDVTATPPHRRDCGMVFQNYALFPHLSVAENVEYAMKIRKVTKDERLTRLEQALSLVGLSGLGKRRIDQLSGGQQQRVALARALVYRPSLLLLDEPLSNLDAKLREETRTQIRQIQQEEGITAVYVTHDQAEAMAMSDRIAVMNGGVLHQLATPREIYRHPATAFVARFIGRSNVLAGTIRSNQPDKLAVELPHGDTVFAPHQGALTETSIGSSAAISIRPEDLTIVEEKASLTDRVPGRLHGTVELIEYTGATCMIAVRLGTTPDQPTANSDSEADTVLINVSDRDDLPAPGEVVALEPHRDRAWLVAP